MTLGEIVKAYRKARGMTMQEFADLAHLSKGYISMLEKGKNPRNGQPITPSIDTYANVARAMSMSPEELLAKARGESVSIPAPAVQEGSGVTARDERDIKKRLDAIRDDLANADGLAFMGGEKMTEDDRALMLDAIESGLRAAKRLAKKYTPKKYLEDGK